MHAIRELYYEKNDQVKKCTINLDPIGKDEISYYCDFECEILSRRTMRIRDQDQMQALILCLRDIRSRIILLNEIGNIKIWWSDENNDNELWREV